MNDMPRAPRAPSMAAASPAAASAPDPEQLEKDLLPPPVWESERVFPLSKSVTIMDRAGKKTLTELKLRSPLALDLFEIGGVATTTNWAPNGMILEMNTERFREWVIRLSGHGNEVISQMAARDLKQIYVWLNAELSSVGN